MKYLVVDAKGDGNCLLNSVAMNFAVSWVDDAKRPLWRTLLEDPIYADHFRGLAVAMINDMNRRNYTFAVSTDELTTLTSARIEDAFYGYLHSFQDENFDLEAYQMSFAAILRQQMVTKARKGSDVEARIKGVDGQVTSLPKLVEDALKVSIDQNIENYLANGREVIGYFEAHREFKSAFSRAFSKERRNSLKAIEKSMSLVPDRWTESLLKKHLDTLPYETLCEQGVERSSVMLNNIREGIERSLEKSKRKDKPVNFEAFCEHLKGFAPTQAQIDESLIQKANLLGQIRKEITTWFEQEGYHAYFDHDRYGMAKPGAYLDSLSMHILSSLYGWSFAFRVNQDSKKVHGYHAFEGEQVNGWSCEANFNGIVHHSDGTPRIDPTFRPSFDPKTQLVFRLNKIPNHWQAILPDTLWVKDMVTQTPPTSKTSVEQHEPASPKATREDLPVHHLAALIASSVGVMAIASFTNFFWFVTLPILGLWALGSVGSLTTEPPQEKNQDGVSAKDTPALVRGPFGQKLIQALKPLKRQNLDSPMVIMGKMPTPKSAPMDSSNSGVVLTAFEASKSHSTSLSDRANTLEGPDNKKPRRSKRLKSKQPLAQP